MPNSGAGEGKPRLLLMGQSRSGKSSISSVVFHKMPPTETLFLESTSRIQKDATNSFMDFQVWDFPGQIDFKDTDFDMDTIFGDIGALIYVLDAQDEYLDAIESLNRSILFLQQFYPNIKIEVFIHKVDGLSDDFKLDIQREITQRIQDELSDEGYENAPVSYHLTSIYDHSIFEAFSKVIQKLIPQLDALEGLLNLVSRACHYEKAYLFDVLSKIYIATDTSPSDMSTYEICSDYIDVIVDISDMYNWDVEESDMDWVDNTIYPDAESMIVLLGGKSIYLLEMNKYLAMIGVFGGDITPYKNVAYVDARIIQKSIAEVFGFRGKDGTAK
ncbi:MAG: hypothetical protein M1814_004635 [Vezdaea aestivalis]|nr:MAG: hypothetical protein M1814_004635 [Vezdaea aestivalis]